MAEENAQNVFGLTPYKFKKDDKTYNVLRPLKYAQHEYEVQGEVVLDRVTGLMWQKSDSEKYMTYKEALKYIATLNRKKFAGYDDWRLPTLPELMSLLEPTQKNGEMFIDPIFDNTQTWCWSADKRREKGECSAESAWDVNFDYGSVYWYDLYFNGYVRGVRS